MSLSVPSPASGPQAICSRLGGNREAIQGAPCLCLPRPPRRSEQMAPLPSLHTNQGAPRPSWRRGLVGSALLSQDWSAPSFRPCTPSSLGFCCHIRHFPHLALPSQPPSPIQRGIGEGHALRCHQAGPWGPAGPLGPHTGHDCTCEAAQFLRGQGQLEPKSGPW